jgi:putative RNA 2'-phosphotransferase
VATNEPSLKDVSKHLSFILLHRPDSVGLSLGKGGWLGIDELLAALADQGEPLPAATLQQVVAQNDKQRFEISGDGERIRAR